jgi:hypothetical protein
MADITRPANLNPARRHRSYPRAVKRARHNAYRLKRPGETGTTHNGPPAITLRIPSPRPPQPNKIKIS